MVGDVIDTFRNTTSAVNQKVVQKIKLKQVPRKVQVPKKR